MESGRGQKVLPGQAPGRYLCTDGQDGEWKTEFRILSPVGCWVCWCRAGERGARTAGNEAERTLGWDRASEILGHFCVTLSHTQWGHWSLEIRNETKPGIETKMRHQMPWQRLLGSPKCSPKGRSSQSGDTSRRIQKDERTSYTGDTPVISALGRLRRREVLTSRPASAMKELKASPGCRENWHLSSSTHQYNASESL